MLRTVLAAALAVIAVNAVHDPSTVVSIERPVSILTAPDGRIALRMSEPDGGRVEIAAVVTPRDGEVRTVRLSLSDGERATMALPGQPQMSVRLQRRGDNVVARLSE